MDVCLWRLFVNWILVKCYVTIFFGVIYAIVNVIVVIFERYRYRIFKFCSVFLDLFNKFNVSVDLIFLGILVKYWTYPSHRTVFLWYPIFLP